MANDEKNDRTYLLWSTSKNALFYLPCRIFNKNAAAHKSSLASPDGYSVQKSFKKNSQKVTAHESSPSHVECFLEMNSTRKRLNCGSGIDFQFEMKLRQHVEKWRSIFKRILHVVLFLGKRGLPFRGSVEYIGDSRNGDFLGLLELLAKFDSLLCSHLTEVKISQEKDIRMKAHYLSPQSQNECIEACGKLVPRKIIADVLKAVVPIFVEHWGG